MILLEANPPHPGSDAVVGSYMYLELAADEGKKSNEPFLCLPAYMHSPEIYCHFTTSCVRSLVVFTIQWLFLNEFGWSWHFPSGHLLYLPLPIQWISLMMVTINVCWIKLMQHAMYNTNGDNLIFLKRFFSRFLKVFCFRSASERKDFAPPANVLPLFLAQVVEPAVTSFFTICKRPWFDCL